MLSYWLRTTMAVFTVCMPITLLNSDIFVKILMDKFQILVGRLLGSENEVNVLIGFTKMVIGLLTLNVVLKVKIRCDRKKINSRRFQQK